MKRIPNSAATGVLALPLVAAGAAPAPAASYEYDRLNACPTVKGRTGCSPGIVVKHWHKKGATKRGVGWVYASTEITGKRSTYQARWLYQRPGGKLTAASGWKKAKRPAPARALLNDAARDVDDTHCGGTADANNVWGEGKLDILGAVDASPRTAALVTGTLTDRATGVVLAGMTVKTENAGFSRTVLTDADGRYRLALPAGEYTVTVSGYGYATATEPGFTVTTGETATHDLTVNAFPHHAVTGTVLDVTGRPLPGATVHLLEAPITAAVSDATGRFTLPDVAEGSFTLTATPAAPVKCNGIRTTPVTVDGDETVTAALPNRTDAAGTYGCAPAAYSWIDGRTAVALSGDENAATVNLPFPSATTGSTTPARRSPPTAWSTSSSRGWATTPTPSCRVPRSRTGSSPPSGTTSCWTRSRP
ncbi:carboxypeptidase regulatory-like domain-containing protein [Streptomyces hydrogenans]|uniref:carboxypeptidase regulatory-like domain-containing protein n=1 Tax=Streptomyces hydrogenans TaxID=1873719 RepID=UPI00341D2548